VPTGGAALSAAAAGAASVTHDQIDAWMQLAIEQAEAAGAAQEVPVGAVVIAEGEVIGRGYNRSEADDDPSAHAEVVALRAAGKRRGDWRLDNTTLVVTLEPCPMCIAAIIQARVARLISGAPDPRYGACGSALPLPPVELTPHLREIRHATHPDRCGDLLREFFRRRRA